MHETFKMKQNAIKVLSKVIQRNNEIIQDVRCKVKRSV